MSWNSYITTLLNQEDGLVIRDAAIVSHKSNLEAVWASSPGLEGITTAEIKALVNPDRSKLLTTGTSVAGINCRVLRDNRGDTLETMDMRTKKSNPDSITYSICVVKSAQALVVVQAKKDVHGGKVNKIAFDMADYLRKKDF
ncbi:profilin-1 isoform X1 [Alosa sapidissima]|uniref:profilin-1 isoform X1 n=1 Tax=Alosa sapidissima TaxID=34773 RepID=UPI001C0836C5|nr:profilin-1 isoform X1 [Alosa sapidissima]